MPATELHKFVHHKHIIICKVRTKIFLNAYTLKPSLKKKAT